LERKNMKKTIHQSYTQTILHKTMFIPHKKGLLK
jgi:hypothetical protein